MGLRIIVGHEDGGAGPECAVLYCSTMGIAFGPVISDPDGIDAHSYASAFLAWLHVEHGIVDARSIETHEILELWGDFVKIKECI